jgi:hypothetical protein
MRDSGTRGIDHLLLAELWLPRDWHRALNELPSQNQSLQFPCRFGRPQGAGGHGSKLLERTVAGHLGGTISYNWTPGGALVTLKLDANRLAS